MSRNIPEKVVIFGGGVAGLSAAHELAERGFSVVVCEARGAAGGKARSFAADRSLSPNLPLPAEHGFRFFPGFYRHVIDTMARIPFGRGRVVRDNLSAAKETVGLTVSNGAWTAPNRAPSSVADLRTTVDFLFQMLSGNGAHVPAADIWLYIERMLTVLGSCDERRFGEYEYLSWWHYMDAERRSPEYQRYVVAGLTKTLVACRAQDISTRTGGGVGAQLLLDVFRGGSAHVLNGPTSDVWIDPWLQHLRQLGVEIRFETAVKRLRVEARRVVGASVQTADAVEELSADHYLLALPVEAVLPLLDVELLAAAPGLARLRQLRTAWMAGAQLYLDCDLELNHGHTVYLDSPWALTSISQTQFWPSFRASDHAPLRALLSVCISDWDTPGVLHGKPARLCSPDEIRSEVWEQLHRHWPSALRGKVSEANVLHWQLDPAIRFGHGGAQNAEPLLINTCGSWDHRPDATTPIENLFLAADYVRTHTDLATMEGANEAARRASNAIIERSGTDARPCAVWALSEPAWLAPMKAYDRLRWSRGLPAQSIPLNQLGPAASGVASVAGETFRGVVDAVGAELLRRGVDRQVAELDWKARAMWTAFRSTGKGGANGPGAARAPAATSPRERSPGQVFAKQLVSSAVARDADPRIAALGAELVAGLESVEDELLAMGGAAPERRVVDQVVAHIVQSPGKHLRAQCVLLCASVGRRVYPAEAIQLAAVVELVHGATLLHDDVIDTGERRRGRPTARLLHGELASVLGGDLLMLRASAILLELGRPDLFRELVATMETIVEAESRQLENRGRLLLDEVEYLQIIRGKTAVLFGWACAVGAVAAGRPTDEIVALRTFGDQLGTAFQIVDDLLDVSGDPHLTGKARFADLREGKTTYPLIAAAKLDPQAGVRLGRLCQSDLAAAEAQAELTVMVTRAECLAATRRRAEDFAEAALAVLDSALPGPANSLLRALVHASIARER